MKPGNRLAFFSLLLFFIFISAGCLYQTPSTPGAGDIPDQPPIPFPSPGKANITHPGLYYLTTDITPWHISKVSPDTFDSSTGMTASHFIVIRSSNVILDGMGHTIDGSRLGSDFGYTYGIYVIRPPRSTTTYSVIIRNITVTNWSTGIFVRNVDNFTLEDSSVLHNDGAGVSLFSSSDITIIHDIISYNNGFGITGNDVGKVIVSDTTINGNHADGVALSGVLEVPVRIEIPYTSKFLKKNYLDVYPFHTVQKTTSGNGFVITRNEITGNMNGITLSNTENSKISFNSIRDSGGSGVNSKKNDNLTVSDNTITGNKHYGLLFHNPHLNLVEQNDTFSGNGFNKQENLEPGPESLSVILGVFLFGILKVLGGIFNITSKVETSRFTKWASSKCSDIRKDIAAAIRGKKISVLFEAPAAVTIIGAVIFGGAYAYASSIQLTIEAFCAILITGGIVTVTPRAVQYLIAQKNGLESVYRLWWEGIIVIIITMLLPLGAIFGQPVRMEIRKETFEERGKILLTKFTGPLTLIALSLIFFLLYLLKGPVASFAISGLKMSLLSAVVLLLPVSPMEGKYILNWNKKVWAIVFIPVLIAYFYVLLIV